MAFSELKLVAWAFPKYNTAYYLDNAWTPQIQKTVCMTCSLLFAFQILFQPGLFPGRLGCVDSSKLTAGFSQPEAPAGQQRAREVWGQSLSCSASSLPNTQIFCFHLSKSSSCHRTLFTQLSQQFQEPLSPLAPFSLGGQRTPDDTHPILYSLH